MAPILGIWASSKAVVADTGAYFPLQVITVGSAGASSITFSNIPNTYTHLQLRCLVGINAAASYYMRFNSDSAGNYRDHNIYGNGTSASVYDYGNSGTYIRIAFPFEGINSATSFAGQVTDILDYASTNKNKTTRSLVGVDRNGSGQVSLQSGLWMNNTTAISSITIAPDSSTFLQNSSFALYGIKGA